jgi:hypothetical protein
MAMEMTSVMREIAVQPLGRPKSEEEVGRAWIRNLNARTKAAAGAILAPNTYTAIN